jgi:XTP/dITP diphosphohydrolase
VTSATGPGSIPDGLTLLLTTPRVAPGLLTRDAWLALGAASLVLAADPGEPVPEAIASSGIEVQAEPGDVASVARRLVTTAQQEPVVWVFGSDGDPGLTDAIAAEVSRLEAPPTVEVLTGSWDVPGAGLLDVVAVMDRLRSPGGCPWDAQQTHASLAAYLTEEAAEAVEAIESGDRDHLVEELGDVLLQVAFHARVGQEDPQDPFDIDDIAATLVAKLVRRHPHVFADAEASTPEEVEAQWAAIKAAEKAARR